MIRRSSSNLNDLDCVNTFPPSVPIWDRLAKVLILI